MLCSLQSTVNGSLVMLERHGHPFSQVFIAQMRTWRLEIKNVLKATQSVRGVCEAHSQVCPALSHSSLSVITCISTAF